MKVERGIFILIIILLLASLGLQKCSSDKRENELVKNVMMYSSVAQEYALKSGALVATNKSLVATTQKQMETFAASINDTLAQIVKKYKSVQNITYATSNFYAGKDTIKTKNNIPCDFKPYPVRESDSTYTFKGTVAKNYFSVDSIFVPNKISIVSGRKKIGFMKYDYGCDINNSNPLMKTTNIKSYQYVPEKKWFERTWVHLVAGALIQTGINKGANYLLKK